MTQEVKLKEIRCADECKTFVKIPVDQEPIGWEFLELHARYRCPACRKALENVNGYRRE